MEQKTKYERPKMRIRDFASRDIITTSQLIDGEIGSGGSGSWEDFSDNDL